MTNAIFLRCGRLFARFHFWIAAVTSFSMVRPLSYWDEDCKARFAYACMMSRKSNQTLRVFTTLLQHELNSTPDIDLWLAKIAWSLGRLKLAALIYQRTQRTAHAQPQKDVAVCQKTFVDGLLDESIFRQLWQEIDALQLPHPATGIIVLTPVSSRYFDLFGLWREQLDRYVSGHRLMLALDPDAAVQLRQQANTSVLDLSAYFVFHENGVIDRYTRGNLWILRVVILRELVSRGYTILSLDLDALVVGDLSKLLTSLPESDIIAQEDYSIPMDVARRLGFIICCGFMLVRPNPTAAAFFNYYTQRTILEMDDQLALNHLLEETGIAQGVRTSSYMQFNAAGVSWICPDKSLVSRDIHYGSVIRHFQQAGETIDTLRQAISST